jgi:hypothetical protein
MTEQRMADAQARHDWPCGVERTEADLRDALAALRRVRDLADRLDGPDCKWASFTPVFVAKFIRDTVAGSDFAEEDVTP